MIRNHFSQSIFRQKAEEGRGQALGKTDGRTADGQSAKEAEKIGLTSKRGSRRGCGTHSQERLRDISHSHLRKPRNKVEGAPWRAPKCFRSSLTHITGIEKEGSQKTFAERLREKRVSSKVMTDG